MSAGVAPPQTAAEICKRLAELAPYTIPGRAVSAESLARHLAVKAQVSWARSLHPGHALDLRDVAAVNGMFAAAHALLYMHATAPQEADEAAAQIQNAFDDGGGVGEWLWEFHGEHAQEIADLAEQLAGLTVPKPAATTQDAGRNTKAGVS